MKILHCSDLHFHIAWYESIYKQHTDFDVVCLTGDFLDLSNQLPLSDQITWVRAWLRTLSKPVFICSGNHDYDEHDSLNWLQNIPNVYSDGTVKTINKIKFGCIPYMANEYDKFYECDVLLTHVPPENTETAMDRKTKHDFGDRELYRLLKHKILRPKYVLCGHIHNPIKENTNIHDCIIHNACQMFNISKKEVIDGIYCPS